jgi:hypothetical protein
MLESLFALLFMVGLLFAIVTAPRFHSKRWLTKRIYYHVDEVIGARRFESDHATTQRTNWGWFWGDELAAWLWPLPKLSGAVVMPRWWRRNIYVKLGLAEKPWPQPYYKTDIEFVTLAYTSEVPVNDPDFITDVECGKKPNKGGLAQALSLIWHEDLFEHPIIGNPLYDHRPERDEFTFVLAEVNHTQKRIKAAEEVRVEQADTSDTQ